MSLNMSLTVSVFELGASATLGELLSCDTLRRDSVHIIDRLAFVDAVRVSLADG